MPRVRVDCAEVGIADWLILGLPATILISVVLLPGTGQQRFLRVIGLILLAGCAISLAKPRPAVLAVAFVGVLLSIAGWRPVVKNVREARWAREGGPPEPEMARIGEWTDVPAGESSYRARESFTEDGRPFLELVADVDTGGRHLRVASREWKAEFHPDARMTRLDFGIWPYEVHTTDAELAWALLDRGARARIERLDGMHRGAFLFEIRARAVVVRAEGVMEAEWRRRKASPG